MLKPSHGEGRKAPLSSMTDSGGPQSYAKPTEKPILGKHITTSYDIADYGLPVIDVDTERRNFPGYGMAQHYSMEEIMQGDSSGTTETDATNPDERYERGDGYTTINSKGVQQRDRWPNRRS